MDGITTKQLAHVCIYASDLERTRRFYADVLGMPVVFRFLRAGEVIGYYLGGGGRSHIEVFRKPEAEYGELNRINHLCLEVQNIDAAIAHIRARGAEVTDKKLGCDRTFQAWVRDPDGVRIELFEYTGDSAQFRGGDRVADW
jgi:lactoylglutathione lyase/glyoxylase I family protein